MSEDKLKLATREVTGKKIKSLRKDGLIPSVVYGGEKVPILTASPYNLTKKVLRNAGFHSPIDLDLAGKNQMAMVKNIDIDPVKRTIRNVEFQAISADEIVEATTPIVIIGFEISEAAKANLSTLQVVEEIAIKAKPADLPSQIELDATPLSSTEDRLTIADLALPKGVELADKELDPETTVLNVFDPAIEAAARAAELEAAQAETAEEAPAEEAAPAESENPESQSA